MNIHTLIKTTQTRKKRLGQGHGSGRVKTSGRGQKGQQARRNIPLAFEGGAQPLTKRIPFLRGKDRNFSFQVKPIPVNVESLGVFEKGAVVDMASLVKKGLIIEKEAKKRGVKILAHGTVSVSLTIKLPTSLSAKEKIEKAGGSVEFNIK